MFPQILKKLALGDNMYSANIPICIHCKNKNCCFYGKALANVTPMFYRKIYGRTYFFQEFSDYEAQTSTIEKTFRGHHLSYFTV